MTEPNPKIPGGLKTQGKRFWLKITGAYDVPPAETLLLIEACRCLDRLELLAAKDDPRSIAEHRQQAILLSRLVGQLDLPDVTPATSSRGKSANAKRWEGHIVRGGVG